MSATPAQAGPGSQGTEEKVKVDVKTQIRRVVQGDLASVRVVLGLALIWIIFQVQEPRFLSDQNLTNLMLQITATGFAPR